MPSLIGTTVATNYLRVTGPDYTESSQTRTYTGPFSVFGTRDLVFIKLTAVGNDGTTAVNFSTNYLNSNSDFSIALRTIQNFGEVYYATTPNATGFAVAVSRDTVNAADSGTTQGSTAAGSTAFGLMETAIVSALAKGGTSAATMTALTPTGVSIA
jgi:hypothetical protein